MEETPCPVLSSDQRRKMGKLAVRAAEAIGYRNAGDFTRAYRRRYGLSPREYRQARQGVAGEGD
jgi:biotin carboxylase